MQKLLLTLPDDLLFEIDEAVEESQTNRTELIRLMLKQQLLVRKKKRLHALMAEGYSEMWKQNEQEAEAYLSATQYLGEE